MKKNKHIAMWCCSRSRSTVTLRAFEQLEECLVYASPFYAAYLLHTNAPDPHREDVFNKLEKDYQKLIKELTGDLPQGKTFSFQRHVVQHVLPEFGREWCKEIEHFFLIRHPKEMILSYYQLQKDVNWNKQLTLKDLGLKALNQVFEDLTNITGKIPMVVDAEDLVKDSHQTLKFICDYFNIDFSTKMLSWKPGLEDSILQNFDPTQNKEWLNSWCSTVMNTTGFVQTSEKNQDFPEYLLPLLEECLPYYEKLSQYRHQIVTV